ncbi:hyoscyamine 6-dioxygenase-like [Coffea eugenioides]|uniref:hyoscyamine 6-dioxygenase-like n=1 Tax=Coffea eugenioides TaxID=49369 RepID=UPI000F611D62|nr:hyoscyamine 6-dioxygenase-like [Coffea eugenioides]
MASLLSSWSSNLKSLPENYAVPEGKRPGKLAPISRDIPVIDLGEADRAAVVQKIIKASQEFGLFQVINHGVTEKLMIDAMDVGKEFFSIAVEEKMKLTASAGDTENGWELYTGAGKYSTQDFDYWKDSLLHPCHPLESCIKSWPDKPARYRKVMVPYIVEVRELGKRVLELIYEGLGFTEDNFDNYDLFLMIHNYPECPDPSSALGAAGHYDGNLITFLQQDVYGLQLFKDGEWLGAEPLPNAFVINIGFALEVISNGKLKSAFHRVVTNSDRFRTSFANFFNLPFERIIEPAKSVVSPSNPPVYRRFLFKEYMEVLMSKNSDTNPTVDYFKIKN